MRRGYVKCFVCDGKGITIDNKLCISCKASGKTQWIDGIGYPKPDSETGLIEKFLNGGDPSLSYTIRIGMDITHHAKQLLEEIIYNNPGWSYLLRVYCPSITSQTKRLLEEAVCFDSEFAYYLRIDCKDLSKRAQERAERAVCHDPEWAFWLRKDCINLSTKAKEMLEMAICKDPKWSFWLIKKCDNISPKTICCLMKSFESYVHSFIEMGYERDEIMDMKSQAYKTLSGYVN